MRRVKALRSETWGFLGMGTGHEAGGERAEAEKRAGDGGKAVGWARSQSQRP